MCENEKMFAKEVRGRMRNRTMKWMFLVLAVVLLAASCFLGYKTYLSSRTKPTKLGFEDIGEFATQAAYCTEVQMMEASQELFGFSIPFTQSKYIYSYDVVLKAGIDFSQVKYEVTDKTIKISLPKARILSNEINLDSFQVYHENESVFRQIRLDENNRALQELKQKAEETAIFNGLLDEAERNAQVLLEGFFAQAYSPDEYDFQFSVQ